MISDKKIGDKIFCINRQPYKIKNNLVHLPIRYPKIGIEYTIKNIVYYKNNKEPHYAFEELKNPKDRNVEIHFPDNWFIDVESIELVNLF